jgi:hypothetical protein
MAYGGPKRKPFTIGGIMKRNKAEKMVIRLAKECQSNNPFEIYENVYWKIFNLFEGKRMPPEYGDALTALKHNLGGIR